MIAQLREEKATEQIDIKPNLLDYYYRHMSDGTFVSWLALDGGKIVGTSGMSFVENHLISVAHRVLLDSIAGQLKIVFG